MQKSIFYNWIPAFVATAAIAASCYGSFGCETVVFHASPEAIALQNNDNDTNNTNTTNIFSDTNLPTALYLGPWMYEEIKLTNAMYHTGWSKYQREVHQCVPYSRRNMNQAVLDTPWRTARAFSVITLLFSIVPILLLWFIPCGYRRSTQLGLTYWKYMAFTFMILLTICQGLTLVIYSKNSAICQPYTPFYESRGVTDKYKTILQSFYPNTCEWAIGSTSSVVAMILFFITGIIMFIMGPPETEPTPPPETQQVTYQRTQNPDGTSTIQEVHIERGTAVPKNMV